MTIQDILDATTPEQILAALAALAGCDTAPSEADLAAFLPDISPAQMAEANSRSSALYVNGLGTATWIEAEKNLICKFEIGPVTHFMAVAQVHDLWTTCKDTKHPLGPVIEAWRDRPVQVEPETRQDTRVLAVITESRMALKRGHLLMARNDTAQTPIQGELPLFEQPNPKSVPLLELVDANRVPVMSKGRGAPLLMRLFVRLLSSVKPEERGQYIQMAVPVDHLRRALRPAGGNPSQYWEPLKRDILALDNHWMVLPSGAIRRCVVAWELPYERPNGTPDPESVVVFRLSYPEGSQTGPIIDLPTFDQLSLQSASKWRAGIAANSLAWQPGKTRLPVPGAPGRFGWAKDVTAYPVLTAQDQRRLAFGANDTKNRTRADIAKPWAHVPGMVTLTRQMDKKTGEVGIRVVPEAVIEARKK